MGAPYNGDPNNYPTGITELDDSDPPNAASFNPGFEGLADRTECIRAKGLVKLMKQTFTASGTWTAPANLHGGLAFLEGCGGGGGGGGGLDSQAADTHTAGGGGGGGAIAKSRAVSVTAGTAYTVTIGAGGAGAARDASSPGNGGGAGGDTRLLDGASALAEFNGANGGGGGRASAQGPTGYTWGLGGHPAGGNSMPNGVMDVQGLPGLYLSDTPQAGGNGITGNNGAYAKRGNYSPENFSGGLQGAVDPTSAGSYRGGGSGGGGGGGPYGIGGNGGDGSPPNNAGAATDATSGSSAGANTGAGGGGGGSAGNSSSAGSGLGGNGGNGGSGRLTISWWETGVSLP